MLPLLLRSQWSIAILLAIFVFLVQNSCFFYIIKCANIELIWFCNWLWHTLSKTIIAVNQCLQLSDTLIEVSKLPPKNQRKKKISRGCARFFIFSAKLHLRLGDKILSWRIEALWFAYLQWKDALNHHHNNISITSQTYAMLYSYTAFLQPKFILKKNWLSIILIGHSPWKNLKSWTSQQMTPF